MKVIETRIVPATDTKPTRIKAVAGKLSNTCILNDNYSLENNHGYIAQVLAEELGWTGEFIGGHTNDGMVWVMNSIYSEKFTV